MTIPFASAPEPVMDPYASGSNGNVPYAHATSMSFSEQSSGLHGSSATTDTSTAGQPKSTQSTSRTSTAMPVAYSTGAPPQPPRPQPSSPIAIATGAPPQQTQQASAQTNRNNNNNNNNDCCNGRSCCCITAIVITPIFICCILPFIIYFIIVMSAVASIASISYDDDVWTFSYDDDFI